ncbi:MAG: flagellar basal body-associated FliL family protein [Lentisphaerae bacterium]|nr:flagellar basal body-associated FliL family protein [Lentisphaerota bacterium]
MAKAAPIEEAAEEPLEAEEEKPVTEKKPGSKNSLLVMILAGFLAIVLVQVAVVFYVVAGRPAASGDKPVAAPKAGNQGEAAIRKLVYDVDPITVNILGAGGRYVKATAHLVVSEAPLLEALKNEKAMVMDRLRAVLSSKAVFDLEGEKNVDTIKKEIIQRLNSESGDKMKGTILDVYFSEYLLQ